MPPAQHLGDKTETSREGRYNGGVKQGAYNGIPILAGEPEFYPVPAIPPKAQNGDEISPNLPVPALALPYMPSNYDPYINHQMV